MSQVSMLPWDVRLQFRYGFYAVYAVLTLTFAGILRSLPAGVADTGLVLVVFADPSFLGFYFVAALVLFEKRDGVLDALVVSPLSTSAYLLSKALSLALLATAAITLLGGFSDVGWPALLVAVALTSTLFVFIGFVAVARFDSVNAYFMTALAYMSVLGLPVLGLLGLFETPLYYLLPAQPPLVLLGAAVGERVPQWELAYAVGYLLVANGVAFAGAPRAFERHVVAGVDTRSGTGTPVGASFGGQYGPIASLVVADAKNWLRDPLLVYIGFAPILFGLVGRVGVPYATGALADWLPLAGYYPELTAMFVLFGPAIIGFAVGFFVLEDREQGTLTALRLTPLTARGYLVYRGLATVGASFLAALVLVPLVGLVSGPPAVLVGVSLVAALYGPITALVLATVAGNSVEGVAVSKFFGVSVVLPVGAVAVLAPPVQYLAGVFPAYWPVAALVRATTGTASPWPFLLVGALVQTVLLWALARRFVAQAV